MKDSKCSTSEATTLWVITKIIDVRPSIDHKATKGVPLSITKAVEKANGAADPARLLLVLITINMVPDAHPIVRLVAITIHG